MQLGSVEMEIKLEKSNIDYDVIIVGAGLSGLSVAHFILEQKPDSSILIMEKSDRAGGAIKSHKEEGYLAEQGPHGFLDNCPQSRELIKLAQLESEVVKAPLAKYSRYICLGGKLKQIPQTPLKVLKAPLVPLSAKLRVGAEIWQKPVAGEPSVAEWVEKRFGKAIIPFADAVFTGTYAGDIEKLSMDAVMAGVRQMEQQYGSVIRGVVAKLMARKKGKGKDRMELPAMTSFQDGMERLPQALEQIFCQNGKIIYNSEVASIAEKDGGWEVQSNTEIFSARHLVMAIPLNSSLPMVSRVESIVEPSTIKTPEARIVNVLLGFPVHGAEVPFGFGYLAPGQENRFCLGALFSSHMFADRAPEGQLLLEVMVGGRKYPEKMMLTDEELIEKSLSDIKELINLPEPSFARVLRGDNESFPQLEAGYTDLRKWREKVMAEKSNFHFCGFGWQGIGINDMVKEAKRMAERITAQGGEEDKVEVKGVYF